MDNFVCGIRRALVEDCVIRFERQYRLPLTDEVGSFSDIDITDSNRAAILAIRQPDAWQSNAMCLIGPVQCGLGVIGQLWANEMEATVLSAAMFDTISLSEIEKASLGHCVLDLADRVGNETSFLTLLNLVRENDNRILMTARAGPATWVVQKADLKSRLDAVPVAEIYPPDEDMLRLRLQTSCRRRFIKLNDQTLNYLVVRLPRSYAALEDFILRLDEAVEATGRTPNVSLAREVLENEE